MCTEENIEEIQERYRVHNGHTDSYTWKYSGVVRSIQPCGCPAQPTDPTFAVLHTNSKILSSDQTSLSTTPQVLDMKKTLNDNNVIDEYEKFQQLSIDETDEACISEVHVYYNDDLSEG